MGEIVSEGKAWEPSVLSYSDDNVPLTGDEVTSHIISGLTPSVIQRQSESAASFTPLSELGPQGHMNPRGLEIPLSAPPEPQIDAEQLNKLYSPPGQKLFDGPMTDRSAQVFAKQEIEKINQEALERRWQNTTSWPTRMAVSGVLSLLDPFQDAALMTPLIGEEAILAKMGIKEASANLAQRTAARAAAGAGSMAIASVPMVGLHAGESYLEHNDYTIRDAFDDMFIGMGLGAITHVGAGLLHDVVTGRRPAIEAEPAIDAMKSFDEMPVETKQAASQASTAKMLNAAQGKTDSTVDVTPLPGMPASIGGRDMTPEEIVAEQLLKRREGDGAPGVPRKEFNDVREALGLLREQIAGLKKKPPLTVGYDEIHAGPIEHMTPQEAGKYLVDLGAKLDKGEAHAEPAAKAAETEARPEPAAVAAPGGEARPVGEVEPPRLSILAAEQMEKIRAEREAYSQKVNDEFEAKGEYRSPHGNFTITRNMVAGEAPFRMTMFNGLGEPTGHMEFRNLRDAAFEAKGLEAFGARRAAEAAAAFEPEEAYKGPKPLSAVDLLKSEGGVQDEGGNLKAAGITGAGKGRKRVAGAEGKKGSGTPTGAIVGLVNKDGMSLSQALRLLQDRGYLLSDPTDKPSEAMLDDVRNIIIKHHNGEPTYSVHDAHIVEAMQGDLRREENLEAEREALAEIDAYAGKTPLTEEQRAEALKLYGRGMDLTDIFERLSQETEAGQRALPPLTTAEEKDPRLMLAERELAESGALSAEDEAAIRASQMKEAENQPLIDAYNQAADCLREEFE